MAVGSQPILEKTESIPVCVCVCVCVQNRDEMVFKLVHEGKGLHPSSSMCLSLIPRLLCVDGQGPGNEASMCLDQQCAYKNFITCFVQ